MKIIKFIKKFFNSKSDFYLNTHRKNIKEGYKDFSNILDVYADLTVILNQKML